MLIALTASPGFAQAPAAVPETPYDNSLNRLAETLGSIHYLQNLCGEKTNQWRDEMQSLISVEAPNPARRARLIASFNRGYRSFNSVYTVCTDQARTSADGFLDEGVALTKEIYSRYGE